MTSAAAPSAVVTSPALSAPQAPGRLRCEYLVNPLGLDVAAPRLSWEVRDPRRDARQGGYRILVARTAAALAADTGDLWDTGRVASDRSIHVAYAGAPLASLQTAYWKVRTWDAAGNASPWSADATWEMGLLAPTDWVGQWIGTAPRDPKQGSPSPYLRRDFTLRGPVVRARLTATARGLYELHLNGQRVGQDHFTPGWTDYHVRIPYQVYDVTALLKPGANAVGAILGDGWYAGFLVWKNYRCHYGNDLSFLAQLTVTYADGSSETIATGPDWRVGEGPIRLSDIYNGEDYDANHAIPGWDTAGYAAAAQWPLARILPPPPKAALVAKRSENVRVIETRVATVRTEPTPGVFVYDFNQNLVGWLRLRMTGRKGSTVTLRFAEMLNNDGTMYVANLRSAKATDTYTFAADGTVEWEPTFTFHGFRYAEVVGASVAPAPGDLTAVVLHSATADTGTFECSHPMVNQLQSNIRWGQKGNFFEAPTDCPQRDERLGWTGDAQMFIRTATFNMDVAAFFTKWCQDLEDEQAPNGSFPDVAPNVLLREGGIHQGGNCAWADAGVICPWTIYLAYGDTRILETHFVSMAKWVNYMRDTSTNLVRPRQGYGDWLAIDAPDPGSAPTPQDLIGTAYFYQCCRIVAQAAKLVGRPTDAAYYAQLGEDVKVAFNREFVTPGGRVLGHSQTSYLLALAFDLLPEAKRPAAVAHLVADFKRRNYHLSTGFVGTPFIAPVLSKFGQTDVAYKLLLQDTFPSWFYSIINGATTMWERWNSYTKDKGFGPVDMNSFNHYAYGAIGEWLYNTVAGLDVDPEQPGFRHLVLHPEPGGGLTWARAELRTMYGPAACGWQILGDRLTVTVTVPANASATLKLPIATTAGLVEAGVPVTAARLVDGRVVVELGAGTYVFSAPWPVAAPTP